MSMIAHERWWIGIVVGLGLSLAACGPSVGSPPDYSWVFDVTVEPVDVGDPQYPEDPCVDPGTADAETFTYGLVVEGDTVGIYSDDSKLAEGSLRGTYISYASTAPFADYRTGAGGEPLEIEWLIEGHVSFVDQNLTESKNASCDDAMEVITLVSVPEPLEDEYHNGCQHVSCTVWEKRR